MREKKKTTVVDMEIEESRIDRIYFNIWEYLEIIYVKTVTVFQLKPETSGYFNLARSGVILRVVSTPP